MPEPTIKHALKHLCRTALKHEPTAETHAAVERVHTARLVGLREYGLRHLMAEVAAIEGRVIPDERDLDAAYLVEEVL